MRRVLFWILALIGTGWTGFCAVFILSTFPLEHARDGMHIMGWMIAALLSACVFWVLPMMALGFFIWLVRPRYPAARCRVYVDGSYARQRMSRSANDRYPSERVEPRFGE